MKLSVVFPTKEFDNETPQIEVEVREVLTFGGGGQNEVTGYFLTYEKKFFLTPEEFKKVVAAGE